MIVTADGQIKVLVQGTVAPEYVRGEGADPGRIYSLGIVLYELVTGRPPFTGDSPLQIAYRHLEEARHLPTRSGPGSPPRCRR